MTPQDIQTRHDELGYTLGWTFIMTKQARLHDALVCLVGLNPGGDVAVKGRWSCEDGNTYHTEKWRGNQTKYSPLQVQIHRLEKLLGLEPESYLAAQFIPFRSADWERLGNKPQAVAFGQKVWTWVLDQSPAKLFLCLGSDAARQMAKLIDAPLGREVVYPAGWGSTSIGRFEGSNGRVVVRLPHLSRSLIFGRQAGRSAEAEAGLGNAIKPICSILK